MNEKMQSFFMTRPPHKVVVAQCVQPVADSISGIDGMREQRKRKLQLDAKRIVTECHFCSATPGNRRMRRMPVLTVDLKRVNPAQRQTQIPDVSYGT
jgi:hypothetical protein